MSAAKDEAEDGPLRWNNEDNKDGGKTSPEVENEHTQEEELLTPKLSKRNGFEEEDDSLVSNEVESEDFGPLQTSSPVPERPSSADESLSIPDDTPSLQGSIESSSPGPRVRVSSYGQSPTPSLRPFDKRFQARLSPSPLNSPRASSPAFLNAQSRQSSAAFSIQNGGSAESPQAPWEVVRWTKLRKMTGEAFSELGKRKFGRPTCIAIAASIALGTSKGIILVFDYSQNLKSIIGLGTKAVESGSVTSISISADHSTIAGGHASGSIFTWEVARPAKPFLHIPPIDRSRAPNADGHTLDVAILHIGFLGMRHTALASADDKGMAFSHLATRGMGVVARSVKTTRILGRYPDKVSSADRQRKPSSVLAFSPLPLGNAEHAADSLGLVAMLTPYLLVVVSTTPIAQTQYKAPRPKEVAAHGAMTAALAWFPSVKLKKNDPVTLETFSRVKLVYCWSNILTVLDVIEAETSASHVKDEPPSLQFKPRSRWKAEEAIVGVQWLGRSVLAALTITQQLVILEDNSMAVTDSSDLIQKHIYHVDLFSSQLNQLVDQLEDEEVAAMHGVVADAFYMSFRAYKGRLFLLGYNEISFGTLSNWADRLLVLMEEGSHIAAIQLATSYYSGEANKVAVGLPEDDTMRHNLVQEKLSEMISASLRYTFDRNRSVQQRNEDDGRQLEELASACIKACISMEDTDFLSDDVYNWYQDGDVEGIFLESLEPYIVDDKISVISPVVIKDLVGHYTAQGLNTRIEEMICHLDSRTMDIDQITTLCKRNHLYDALLYVWNQALNDYTTILTDLLDLAEHQYNSESEVDPSLAELELKSASKVFPYLSYVLTGRIYPTGKDMPDEPAILAKAEIYHLFFSGSTREGRPVTQGRPRSSKPGSTASFPNLRRILNFDAASFLSMLNEAFEDNFLNGPQDQMANETPGQLTEEQKFGLSVNRQWIVSILLEVMTPPNYESDDSVYLDMFIARNLPKFPQFILLPGHVLHRVLIGLCQYPTHEVADDCQLSVEYLLSMYQPPDLTSLIPLISTARFYRVLKSIYKQEQQFAELLKTCFEDYENQNAIFDCIDDCLQPSAGLSEKQVSDVRSVIVEHAYDLVAAHVQRAASIIDTYAPDLHSFLLDALGDDESARFQYLQTLLEPSTPKAEADASARHQRNFVEQYVRLMCDYNRPHVSTYVDQLKTGDLRLDEVLPALEDSGVVDAAVVLMAREGKVREAIDRLTHHLITLESALLGLIDGGNETPNSDNTAEAADLIASVQQYARVGVWLCRGQTKSAGKSNQVLSRAKSVKSLHDALSSDEEPWLNLIDAVVTVTKDVTEVLERQDRTAGMGEDDALQPELAATNLDSARMVTDLRTTVQETFTALLAATSAPHNKDARRTDVSFLRILRAFLDRATLSSPSLSNLRAVLGAIFSAYSYEESLLSLANRLLDKDLFVHVTEADALRRRGWRPLGQVCEGCGRRVWGPGAGGYVWDAWERSNGGGEEAQQPENERRPARTLLRNESGKGKSVTRNDGDVAASESTTGTGNEGGNDENGAVVIFSCRHMFHRACLLKMQDRGSTDEGQQTGTPGPDLACPLET